VLAQNLQRSGNPQDQLYAEAMLKNPAAGMGAMQMMDQRALDQAQMAQYQGTGDLRSSQARQEGAIADMIQGYTGQGSGQPGGQPGDLTGIKGAYALMSRDSDKVQKFEDRAAFPSGWKREQLLGYKGTDAKNMEVFDSVVKMKSSFPRFDVTEPLSVYEMLKLFEKGIDDGIVRKDDIDAMQNATGSTIAQLIAEAKSLTDAGAEYSPAMGEAIKNQLRLMLHGKMQQLVSFGESHENYGDQVGWTENARNTAIPYRKETQDFQAGLNNLSAGFMHTLPDGSQVMVAPKGDGFQTIDPNTGEFID